MVQIITLASLNEVNSFLSQISGANDVRYIYDAPDHILEIPDGVDVSGINPSLPVPPEEPPVDEQVAINTATLDEISTYNYAAWFANQLL